VALAADYFSDLRKRLFSQAVQSAVKACINEQRLSPWGDFKPLRLANRRVFLLVLLMLLLKQNRIAAHRAFPRIIAKERENLPLQESFSG